MVKEAQKPDPCFACVKCDKPIDSKELQGSWKHPYCKQCFKKEWNDDFEAYFQWLGKTH